MSNETVRKALEEAVQLAEIASDWHLDEVEIDGEMVSIYDLQDRFKAAIAALSADEPPLWYKMGYDEESIRQGDTE